MEKGDLIYIYVLDDIIAYEVDNIDTISPKDTKLLKAHKEKDIITLITCTPYGINTHRLVVQGHRVPYIPVEHEKINTTKVIKLSENFYIRILGVLLGIVIIVLLFNFGNKIFKSKDSRYDEED